MNELTINLMGFPAVTPQLDVELLDPVTRQTVRKVKPFLDGTVRVPKVDPGAYELRVVHPNLVAPVVQRPIRVLPVGDTKVSVLIDPSKFRNTPIEDIPEANLTPVRQLADSVADTLVPLGAKRAGEAIKADDWNAMASAIRDLAGAVGELTRLVSPTGHDHTELIRKIEEMQGNFDTLLTTLSGAMAELQRQIQSLRFRRQIESVLSVAQIDPTSARGREFFTLVDDLEQSVTESPAVFGRKARNVGVQLETRLSQLIDEKRNDPATPNFEQNDSVKGLTTSVELLRSQSTTSYESELEHNRKADRAMGTGGLSAVLQPRLGPRL